MRTATAILNDVYNHALSYGYTNIYKTTRPTGSKNDDVVVRVIAGGYQKHNALATINVVMFYEPIMIDTTNYIDTVKAEANEASLLDFSNYLNNKLSGIKCLLNSREIVSSYDDVTKQSYTILRMTINN